VVWDVFVDLACHLTDAQRCELLEAVDAIVPDSACVGPNRSALDEVYFTVEADSEQAARSRAKELIARAVAHAAITAQVGITLQPRSSTPARSAAFALARGDALEALGFIGRLEDAGARLLRGIAYAQMGDLELARHHLEHAEAEGDALTSARAAAAMAEIDLAAGRAGAALRAARLAEARLEHLGDPRNAAMQRLVASRALVLLGDLDAAWSSVRDVPAELADVGALVRAEVATRRLDASGAFRALEDVARSPHALLVRVAGGMRDDLAQPVARLGGREVDLREVQAASSGKAFLLDACRRLVRAGRATIPLARRPMLFELLFVLAEQWPNDIARDEVIRRAFGARRPNESHRVRLRVEMGRLRKALLGIAGVDATRAGYVLSSARPVLVLLPLTDDDSARVSTLLGDGANWSAQELAEHAGVSKRTALRALALLLKEGRVLRTGRGADTRYASATGRVASRLLLLGLVPAS
jgi:hypothetical protein